jgi:hypothetical protein
VAAAVWQWFAQLWQQVQPGAVVPITSRVLLLDDFSAWAPPADKQLLWTHLRLLLLESIYSVSSSCSSNRQASSSTAGGGGSSSGATAAAAAAAVQGSNGDGEPAGCTEWQLVVFCQGCGTPILCRAKKAAVERVGSLKQRELWGGCQNRLLIYF